jgi:hypothetical protein
MRNEIANLEEQRDSIRKRLDRGDSFLNKFLNSADPSDLKASLSDIELRLKHQEVKLEESGPPIDAAKQKLDFLTKDYKGRLGDYLNEPENAKRLFDPTSATEAEGALRAKLLSDLLDRLEPQEIIYHVLASYEIRPIAAEASARAAIGVEAGRRAFSQDSPVLAGRKAGLCGAVCHGFLEVAARPSQCRALDHVHGAHSPGDHGAGPRAFATEQSFVRMRAAGRGEAGTGSGGVARDYQS